MFLIVTENGYKEYDHFPTHYNDWQPIDVFFENNPELLMAINANMSKFYFEYMNADTLIGMYRAAMFTLQFERDRTGTLQLPKIAVIASNSNQAYCLYAK